VNYLAIIIISYLLGSIPVGYIVGKLWGIDDIRKHGSGNTGATNVFRVLGSSAGITAAIFDIAKGVGAVIVARHFADPYIWQIIGGLIAIAGHNWSFFLSFQGGKGVATSAGVLLALSPKVTIICLITWALVTFGFKYVSVGSMAAAVAAPILAIIFREPIEFIVFCFLAAAAVIIRHKSNIERLKKGTESKVGKGFSQRKLK
jgi:glycerol-3-phosphate acyltransferase PlsY